MIHVFSGLKTSVGVQRGKRGQQGAVKYSIQSFKWKPATCAKTHKLRNRKKHFKHSPRDWLNHIDATLHPRTHTSGIFYCVSAAELFEQHEAQFAMWLWLLMVSWPGNGLDLGWKNGLVMWASKCRLIKSRVTLANLSAEELEERNFCNRLDGWRTSLTQNCRKNRLKHLERSNWEH